MFQFVSLLLRLATIFLVFISIVCACPLLLVNPPLCMCTTLMLIRLGALAWQKWHAILAMDCQTWIPSRWTLYSKDSNPPSDGPQKAYDCQLYLLPGVKMSSQPSLDSHFSDLPFGFYQHRPHEKYVEAHPPHTCLSHNPSIPSADRKFEKY